MDFDKLNAEIQRLKLKHSLTDVGFDTECLYGEGSLSNVLCYIIEEVLPECSLTVTEHLSADQQQHVATVATADAAVVFTADVQGGDWLPDDFFEKLEKLPAAVGSPKRLYSINPVIGLSGQEAWYFCGTEEQLVAARRDGLPLLSPGEDPFDAPEYEQYGLDD